MSDVSNTIVTITGDIDGLLRQLEIAQIGIWRLGLTLYQTRLLSNEALTKQLMNNRDYAEWFFGGGDIH